MAYTKKLVSFHIVEREYTKKILTWTYPIITNIQKNYILENSFINNQSEYMCVRNNDIWLYTKEVTLHKPFAIVVISEEFEPIKYQMLCDILARKYEKSRNPVDLVALYLNLYTFGSCSFQENGTTYLCNFKNFESSANLKEFIHSFNLEIIFLYTAILLKRRIIMFSTDRQLLLNDLTALRNLVPHRKIDECLFPSIEHPKKLKGLSFYVAGTTNSQIIREERLYDLFVDMQTREITVSPKSEDVMVMTKTHKEIATFLVKLAESDLSTNEIKQQIFQKTTDLLQLLKNLASTTTHKNWISINDLKSKNFHPNLENFLFNLAIAENMMLL